jgi:hypothetical protein
MVRRRFGVDKRDNSARGARALEVTGHEVDADPQASAPDHGQEYEEDVVTPPRGETHICHGFVVLTSFFARLLNIASPYRRSLRFNSLASLLLFLRTSPCPALPFGPLSSMLT